MKIFTTKLIFSDNPFKTESFYPPGKSRLKVFDALYSFINERP